MKKDPALFQAARKDPALFQRDRHTHGAYALYRPGQWFTIRPILKQPHGKVLFAGEQLADWQGFMEGAVNSGEEAAEMLMKCPTPVVTLCPCKIGYPACHLPALTPDKAAQATGTPILTSCLPAEPSEANPASQNARQSKGIQALLVDPSAGVSREGQCGEL